jgi:hypothetical protein
MLYDGINLAEHASILNITVQSGTVFPTNANVAELFYRTDSSTLYAHDGTTWQALGGGGSGGGSVAAEAAKLSTPRLINGVAFDGTANITITDSSALPLAGGTLTGLLVTRASNGTTAGLRLPVGTGPAAPVNGDLWNSGSALQLRVSGNTKTIAFTDSNMASADKWSAARTITLAGDVTGSTSIDGSANVSLTAVLSPSAVLAAFIASGGGGEASTLNGQPGSFYTNITARLGYTPLNASAYTAADVLSKLITVDGAASGLDADLLDGQHGAYYRDLANMSGTLAVNQGGTGVGTITGLIKGNGTSPVTAAVAGTDYVLPTGSITGNASTASRINVGGTAYQTYRMNSTGTTQEWGGAIQPILIAASDETTDLTVGDAKVTFRMPFAFTLTQLPRISLAAAAVGEGDFEVDIKKNGVSIFSTNLTINSSDTTSKTASTPAVLVSNPTVFADDDEVTIDVIHVGISVAGAGLKVALVGYPS